MNQGPRSAKHNKKKKIRVSRIVLIALAVFFGLTAGVAFYFVSAIGNPKALFARSEPPATYTPPQVLTATANPSPAGAQTAQATQTPEPTATPEPTPEYKFEESRVNVLVLGSDSAPERVEAGMNSRTDTMILVSIDLDSNDVDMISLPRDSYIRINGKGDHAKLNTAFVRGGGAKKDGYKYAMDTVSWVLGGVRVDYYLGFGMQAVKDVVNAMGGIDYEVELDFVMNGRETKAGMQHMDGQKVLDYCRFRKTSGGDIGRIDRQQKILMEMFRQLKSTDQIKNIPSLYEALSGQLDTNLNFMQIAALAYWARGLDLADIDKHTLTGSGMMLSGTSYWVIDQGKKKDLVKELFDMDITIPEGEDYASIKAQAEITAQKVNEVFTLLEPLQMGVLNGLINDPSIQNAVNLGYAAMMTEKDADLDAALIALSPYRGYQAVSSTPKTPSTS